jgi:hypothetical protein
MLLYERIFEKSFFISLLSWVLGIDAPRRKCDGCAVCHTDFPLPCCSLRHLYHYSCHIIPRCMEWHRPLLATPLYAIRYKVHLWIYIYTRSPILQSTTFGSYQISPFLKLSPTLWRDELLLPHIKDIACCSGALNINLENIVYANKYSNLIVPAESVRSWFSHRRLMNFSSGKEAEGSLSCAQHHEARLHSHVFQSSSHNIRICFNNSLPPTFKESSPCAYLINHYAMKAYGVVDVEIHIFFTSALAGG